MSSQTVPLNTGQQAIINTDTSKIFLGGNKYETAQYTNGTGGVVNLTEGVVLGRISASGKVTPLTSAAVDGSQFVVGVLAQDISVANGATVNLTFCVEGEVAAEKLVFQGADTLETVVSGRRLRDRIAGDTVGIKLYTSIELSGYDNQ
jgi:hypothetical protein